MSFIRELPVSAYGMLTPSEPSASDAPWWAARLWVASLLTAGLWAFHDMSANGPGDAPVLAPQDLTGIARPARFETRTVPAGAIHVISEPVTLLHTAPVQQIVSVGGEYSINGRPFTAAAGMVWPGNVVRMRVTLAPRDCAREARLIVGVQSTVFRVAATPIPGTTACDPNS